MAKSPRKGSSAPAAKGIGIVKSQPTKPLLRFSFQLFDKEDEEVCPKTFPNGYVRVLMERLKQLEAWTADDFRTKRNHTIRNHSHKWAETARPNGFSGLPEGYESYTPFQFCLTANEYGRVHGVLSADTFYIVWLDVGHKLYS